MSGFYCEFHQRTEDAHEVGFHYIGEVQCCDEGYEDWAWVDKQDELAETELPEDTV